MQRRTKKQKMPVLTNNEWPSVAWGVQKSHDPCTTTWFLALGKHGPRMQKAWKMPENHLGMRQKTIKIRGIKIGQHQHQNKVTDGDLFPIQYSFDPPLIHHKNP